MKCLSVGFRMASKNKGEWFVGTGRLRLHVAVSSPAFAGRDKPKRWICALCLDCRHYLLCTLPYIQHGLFPRSYTQRRRNS